MFINFFILSMLNYDSSILEKACNVTDKLFRGALRVMDKLFWLCTGYTFSSRRRMSRVGLCVVLVKKSESED